MQSLLTPARRPESAARRIGHPAPAASPATIETSSPGSVTVRLSEMQMDTIDDLRRALRENGIAAEPAEIVQALCQAVAVRPVLCRSLLAAYLIGQE